MSRDTLILLTAGFPYGRGEPFLEAEIPFLASAFERIFLFCEAGPRLPEARRCTPENIEVALLDSADKSDGPPPPLTCSGATFASEWIDCIRNYKIFPRRAALGVFRKFRDDALRIARRVEGAIAGGLIDPQRLVIYSYWLTPAALAACILKRRYPGIKAVSRCHGWDVYFERRDSNYLPWRGFLLKGLDKVYCVSGHGASYLEAKTGFKHGGKLEVRYLGTIDPGHLCSPSAAGGGTWRLVSCSWMVALKRLPLIIDALAMLAKRGAAKNVVWTHLGGGDDWEEITAYATAMLGGLTNLEFHFPGSLDNASVHEFYKGSEVDLFLSASEWEGLPVSMMEAAAFGVPIVATDVGGVSEIVVEGRNGFLVPRNVDALGYALAIENFFRMSPGQRGEFRRTSRQIWEERFDAGRNFPDWTEELALP